MKTKILNLTLIITSLFGYLEWGGDNSMFIFQGEFDIIKKLFTDPASAIHPFVLLPLLGQVLILITLFQKEPNKWITWIGAAGIGLLLGIILFIGIIGPNFKMILSTIPFFLNIILVILHRRKKSRN